MLTWVHAAMGALNTHDPDSDYIVEAGKYLLKDVPFSDMSYQVFDKCSWSSSQCAAIAHYTFLESIHHNITSKYDFKLWDFHAFGYRRWSINTILFKGSDLNAEVISADDEQSISEDLPRQKNRHCGAVGQALVVHLAYYPQRNGGADNLLPLFEQLAHNLTGQMLPDVDS